MSYCISCCGTLAMCAGVISAVIMVVDLIGRVASDKFDADNGMLHTSEVFFKISWIAAVFTFACCACALARLSSLLQRPEYTVSGPPPSNLRPVEAYLAPLIAAADRVVAENSDARSMP